MFREQRKAYAEREIPLGDFDEAQDIANMAAFLVSPEGEIHYRYGDGYGRWRTSLHFLIIYTTERFSTGIKSHYEFCTFAFTGENETFLLKTPV